jgi:hypothetical protein
MESLFPITIIVLLLGMAAGRWLVQRSLSLLTVEQKARVMDASSTGNIWPLACVAVGLAIFLWVLPGRIPPPYVLGFLGRLPSNSIVGVGWRCSGQDHSTGAGGAAPALCSQHCLRRDYLLRRRTAVDLCSYLRFLKVYLAPGSWRAIV